MNTFLAKWLLYIATAVAVVSCSDDSDDVKIIESKEDFIGYWAVEHYAYTVKQGNDLIREGNDENSGRLLIMEDGSTLFMDRNYTWQEKNNGFNLIPAAGDEFEFEIISVDYEKMVATGKRSYTDNGKEYSEHVKITCRRLPAADTSLNPDNALLIGSWRHYERMEMPNGMNMEMEMVYEFKANGEYRFVMSMTGMPPIIETGKFNYNREAETLTTVSSEGIETLFKISWNGTKIIINDGTSSYEYTPKVADNSDNALLIGSWRHYSKMEQGDMVFEQEMIYVFNAYGEYQFTMSMKMNGESMPPIIEAGTFEYNKKEGSFTTRSSQGTETSFKITIEGEKMTLDDSGDLYTYVKVIRE